MEACYSSHHWAREFEALGHTVKLIPAQHVKPFTRGNKTDANDAVAIIEASIRPNLRFVPIKTTHQQDIQCLHRIRERLVGNRTGLTNQMRGLLAEYGIVANRGKKGFLLAVESGLNDESLSEIVKTELQLSLDELQQTSDHIAEIEVQLRVYVEQSDDCQILHSMPGIGFINASALVCKYGNGSQFSKARSLPVSLGLTPKLSSSGHRHQMLGISKRGDPYLRKQLIHCARALLIFCDKRPDDALCRWASSVVYEINMRNGIMCPSPNQEHSMPSQLKISLSDQEKQQLEQAVKSRKTSVRLVDRSRIILHAAQGIPNYKIAKLLNININTVGKWRHRYAKDRFTGIAHELPRGGNHGGKNTQSQQLLRSTIINMTTTQKPEGAIHWSTRSLAKVLGINHSFVNRVWREAGLKPHLIKHFKVSNDPAFEEKLKDVVGLYLDPPHNAVVFCVDEKSSIQALDRTQPGLPMKKGRSGTMTHDYKRHGTSVVS